MAKGQAEVPVAFVLLMWSMICHGDKPGVPLWVRRTG